VIPRPGRRATRRATVTSYPSRRHQCDTVTMSSAQPPRNPRRGQAWVDEAGDLYTYDGSDWVQFDDVPFFEPNSSFRDA
jgi:hypothetical protein